MAAGTASTVTAAGATQRSDSKLPLYESSTQFKNWRFSLEQLSQTRTSLNTAAVEVIRNTFEISEPGSSASVLFLTAEDELLLVKLYTSKITQLCGHFRFPEEVEATAMSYLKRFYLKNTVMDWHPKNVMLTALFLATKTTNNPISLEAYTKSIPKTSPSDVLDLEFLVAQSLGFEFAVWHVHRAIWGQWLDFQSLEDPKENLAQETFNAAMTHVRASRLTDAELIYTPSQIALACLSMSSPDLVSRWYHSKLPDPSAQERLRSTLEAIEVMVTSQGHIPPVDSVREIDRRLTLCKNPEKTPGSQAFLAKQAEEERKAEEKRMRKTQLTKEAMENGDPFGEELPGVKDLDDDDD